MTDIQNTMLISEAAALLEVDHKTVSNWLNAGKLNGTKLPGPKGPWLLDRTEIEQLARERAGRRKQKKTASI